MNHHPTQLDSNHPIQQTNDYPIETKKAETMCYVCKNNVSGFHCQVCNVYFCADCQNKVHTAFLNNFHKDYICSLEIEPIEITIRYYAHKKIKLKVPPSLTIKDLKKKIENSEGIDMDKFMMTYNDEFLENESQTISDCNIKNKSTFYLIVKNFNLRIFIELANKAFYIKTNPKDTIENIKSKIQEKEGYQPDQQLLKFGYKFLFYDSRVLSDYNIQEGSTLNLQFKQDILK
ncbi:UBIQUITIN-60S ribosomal protein L40 [Anaeramoeba flamelloides]|uniref:UBIQUITIN-60S ribosomal protein L40 n=1 Tax=Anaeramoeba flamelloides TaxID=1746091 RepID=A0AAV7Z874_9EUKA|nr:UBIQUITIN-60S ribosomal protein L40 [Anaeramoeba flamelloides]